MVSRKSGFSRDSFEQSMTQASAMNASMGMVSTVLLGWSLPLIQWTGASKCVPVCSEHEKLFQYQAGPRSSYREISSIRNGQACPNSGGRTMVGKSGVSVSVRSTIRILPASSSDMNWPSTEVVMVFPCDSDEGGINHPARSRVPLDCRACAHEIPGQRHPRRPLQHRLAMP